jgi:pilus assembly protein CpaC
MRAGETLAISGLVSSDASNSSTGMPFLGQLPIIGQLFRSDSFRAQKSDLVIFVTPLISDPALQPNTGLLTRADRIDGRFRNEYGNPDPLLADDEKAKRIEPSRQPVEATPARLPAPIRSTPAVAEDAPVRPAEHVLSETPPLQEQAPIPPVPRQAPASMPPPGVAEALRRLNASQHAPASPALPVDPAQAALNGKVPAQQIGVLGSPD